MKDVSIPRFQHYIFMDTIPRNVKCISDTGSLSWFEVSSLCQAFDMPRESVESFVVPFQGEDYVSEIDMFATPFVFCMEFVHWYFDEVCPLLFAKTLKLNVESAKKHVNLLKDFGET